MNRGIIKKFKLKIYIIPILLIIHKNIQRIYYIIFIYLITFIVKKLFKKNKRKYETQKKKMKKERKRIERDKTNL